MSAPLPHHTEPLRGALDAATARSVLDLVAAATTADGVSPVSEDARLAIRHGQADDTHLVIRARRDDPADSAAVVGYARVDADGTAELVVAPGVRRRGLGQLLAGAVLEEAEAGSGGAAREVTARFWAHGGLPGALRLAEVFGLRQVRELLTMRRPLAAVELAAPVLPDGVGVRTFTPGRDEEGWLEVNRRAFAHHPEQGAWTARDLRLREGEPWFDPAGFFVAERDGRMVGFHWTKAEPGSTEGEVYVVGVDPDQQGTGLGRALTLVGLRHLRDRGLRDVGLYVEGDNEPALRTYRSLGFEVSGRDLMFARVHD